MKNSTSTWLAGCGVGCVVLVAGLVLLGIGGYFSVKQTVEGFEEMGQTMARVENEFGGPDDFVPWPDGRIPSDRVEAYLEVRRRFAPNRERVHARVQDLDDRIARLETQGGSFWGVVGVIREGIGAIPGLADFHGGRAEALLDVEMGLGEYLYLYSLTSYSYLGKPVSDGPRFNLQDQGDAGRGPERENSGDVWEKRRRRLGSAVNRFHREAIKRLVDRCRDGRLQCDPAWLEQLQEEVVELALEPNRIPWTQGLPEPLETSLKPFRERLEGSYDPLLNPFEMMTLTGEGQ